LDPTRQQRFSRDFGTDSNGGINLKIDKLFYIN
jgi:hypothetical protein